MILKNPYFYIQKIDKKDIQLFICLYYIFSLKNESELKLKVVFQIILNIVSHIYINKMS